MPTGRHATYEPLDPSGCRVLADTLGDTSQTIIATHLLRRALCNAYVAGSSQDFDAAIIQAHRFPGEPVGYGADPKLLWHLLQSVAGWFCVLVSTECAQGLGRLVTQATGAPVRYLDDVCFELSHPAPVYRCEAVRVMTMDDLALIEAAPPQLRASCYRDVEDLLTHGVIACAILAGTVVATALTAARSERYAEIGVYTRKGYRRRGYATVAASAVCRRVQAGGQTPVWSAGASKAASLRVADRLGFREVSRGRYVIAPELESALGAT
jgi:hypothetical protein